jgi:hypothetical protein
MSLFDPPDPPDDGHLFRAMQTLCDVHGWEVIEAMVRRLAPSHVVSSAPARPTDPQTSHAAGPRAQDVGRFSTASRQAKLLQQFAMHPLTDQQATIAIIGSHAAPSAFDGCRRRCSDLRAANYLYDTGKRRKNAGSDDDSVVWGITLAGQQALENLDLNGWSR